MFTLNRLSVSSSTIILALGLMLGGCASETEEPDPSMPAAVEADRAATPALAAEPAAALPAGDEEHLGKNSSEIGFYGGWGMPMAGGWGWGGGWGRGWGGGLGWGGVGWGGPGWGGVGWGGVGWGGGVATSSTFVSTSTMVSPGWGWGMGGGCFGCW